MSIETIIEEASAMGLDELRALSEDLAEMARSRATEEAAPAVMDELVRERGEAKGRKMGDPWERPTSAVDAYPTDAVVTHNGKTWRNLTPANVWEPGESGWREISEDEAAPPEFVTPSGAHDAYSEGDRVTFKGAVWRSLMDGNVWAPDELMRSWFREGTSGDQTSTPPEEENSGITWEPGKTLSAGDIVTYNGSNYTVVQGHTTQLGWEPPNLPALFSPTNS